MTEERIRYEAGEIGDPRWALVMGALSRTGYHEVSARDARERIVLLRSASRG